MAVRFIKAWRFLLFFAVILSLLLFTLCGHHDQEKIFRLDLNDGAVGTDIDVKAGQISLQDSEGYLYLKKPKKAVSLEGLPLGKASGSKGSIREIKMKPRLEGDYFMDLFYFLKAAEPDKKLTPLLFQHRRREKILKKIRMRPFLTIQRLQIPLTLESGDEIGFTIRNGEIEIGLLGNPVFYKGESAEKKSYVFIVIADTLRYDRLGIYNPEKKCSPEIDRFAADSVLFRQAFSTSPWTLPAHMSIFTGLPAHLHGVNYGNEKLNRDTPVLFEILQREFITYCFNADGYMSGLYGFSRGFDYYEESFTDHLAPTAARDLFGKARQFIGKEKRQKALFLLHTYQLHTPYVPEVELAKKLFQIVAPGFQQFRFNPIAFIKNGKELFKQVPEEKRREIELVYDAGVYTFDFRFGEFIRYLKEKHLYDESMIVLVSDHGEEFNDHGGWEHGHSLYNELIKIPLIVKFPGNRYGGKRVDDLVSITDIVPTLLDWYGLDEGKKGELAGDSLLTTINGSNKGAKRMLFAYLAPGSLRTGIPEKIALISENIKYIHQQPIHPRDRDFFKIAPPEFRDEMYDIFADPRELDNIRIRHRKKEKEFRKIIESLRLKRGKKGNLKELEEVLKSLGYL